MNQRASVLREKCRENCGRCDTKSLQHFLKTRLPITSWLPTYKLRSLQCDLIAGLTVGLMVIPQGLAYAVIAGLDPIYGLYSSFMGCFIYTIFGTSKDITLGPTAIMSLMVSAYCKSGFPAYAVAMTLFSGIIQLAMGIFGLGFLVNFISVPIISGFTSSAALTIGLGQVKDLLGLKNIPRPFFERVYYTFKHIGETRMWDLILGIASVIILLIMRKLGRMNWTKTIPHNATQWQRLSRKAVWISSIARNAIIIMISTALAVVLYVHGYPDIFSLTGELESGLPHFQIPSLTTQEGNTTVTSTELLKRMGPGLLIIPLIGFLESIAIAKAFARKNKYRVDPSQELIALGVANLMSSFVSSYPVTGSFSRTAVNAQSGVATPAGGIFTGAIVLLALGVLTPFFKYIPKASLAALIITSVITMVEYRIIKKIWKVKKIDLVSFFVTFLGCFYEIEVGILCGMTVSLLVLLYPIVWPKVIDEKGEHIFSLLKIRGGLNFPGIDHLAAKLQDISFQEPKPTAIVLDFSLITEMDFTVTQGLLMIIEDLENKKIPIHFIRVHDNIRDIMANSGIDLGIINQNLDNLLANGNVNSQGIDPV